MCAVERRIRRRHRHAIVRRHLGHKAAICELQLLEKRVMMIEDRDVLLLRSGYRPDSAGCDMSMRANNADPKPQPPGRSSSQFGSGDSWSDGGRLLRFSPCEPEQIASVRRRVPGELWG